MLVKARVSFVGLGLSVKRGEIIDLPTGADWLEVGLVEVAEAPGELETPEDALPPVEQAVTNKRRKVKSNAA